MTEGRNRATKTGKIIIELYEQYENVKTPEMDFLRILYFQVLTRTLFLKST